MMGTTDDKKHGLSLSSLSSTLGSDATGGLGVLPSTIRPLGPDQHIVARARIVQVAHNDNGAVRVLLSEGEPGEGRILMVSGAEHTTTSVTGGITAQELLALGYVGMVAEGPVRDSREIREGGFKVWCTGCTPTASGKAIRLPRPAEIFIGGVAIHDDDLVMADDDGVTVWPKDAINSLMVKAAEKEASDALRIDSLRK